LGRRRLACAARHFFDRSRRRIRGFAPESFRIKTPKRLISPSRRPAAITALLTVCGAQKTSGAHGASPSFLGILLNLDGTPFALAMLKTCAADSFKKCGAESVIFRADITKNPTINPINTAWTLVAAFLVFCMQAGFTMLEAGFCRSRETVNVLVECVFDTCLCGFLYYTWGYAFMFGQGNGFIGWHDPNDVPGGPVHSWFFLQKSPPRPCTPAPACRCWRTGCSSSPSPTAPRPSAPAR
jgi:hypothetical protein